MENLEFMKKFRPEELCIKEFILLKIINYKL